MKDICKFIVGEQPSAMEYYQFVYERLLKNLKQPFTNLYYRANLVVKGKGTLKTGNTEYLNKVRVDNGIRLISEGSSRISEIAYRTGFSDQFYFSKVFKKQTGESPLKYIKSKK